MNRSGSTLQRSVLTGLLFLGSCATGYEGLKIRAQSPMISEASRRFSLALRADGYEIAEGAILDLRHVTEWRPLTESEKSQGEKESEAVEEARIEIRLYPRAALYDVFVLITIRSDGAEYHPDAMHPMTEKWETLVRELVNEEFREEG